ncbi:MAG: gluconate 2-dehydrogenase subunit 3 family protein [Acidobacteriota bacterium]|nr:gluconate 2-dehydrogenase subunit 3 family protein [Acidobacteriota bacterium]
MESRRDTLKIIGAIGTTCAFPFSADELYGQHVHSAAMAAPPPAGPFQPKFFTAPEVATVSRISELIIPTTDTPGAIDAGVPQYIDLVVSANPEHQKRCREGIAWIDRHANQKFGKPFVQISEAQQIDLLTPLSEASDRAPETSAPAPPARKSAAKNVQAGVEANQDTLQTKQPDPDPDQMRSVGASFFRLMKNLTADGYYTSQPGLVQELGYKGNVALAAFPACTHEH